MPQAPVLQFYSLLAYKTTSDVDSSGGSCWIAVRYAFSHSRMNLTVGYNAD